MDDTRTVAALLESGALPKLARLGLGGTAIVDASSVAAIRPGLAIQTEGAPLPDE